MCNCKFLCYLSFRSSKNECCKRLTLFKYCHVQVTTHLGYVLYSIYVQSTYAAPSRILSYSYTHVPSSLSLSLSRSRSKYHSLFYSLRPFFRLFLYFVIANFFFSLTSLTHTRDHMHVLCTCILMVCQIYIRYCI